MYSKSKQEYKCSYLIKHISDQKLKETMKVQQERLTILDIYVANICAANYIKKNTIGFKRTERLHHHNNGRLQYNTFKVY
jgi:hypothetical protein